MHLLTVSKDLLDGIVLRLIPSLICVFIFGLSARIKTVQKYPIIFHMLSIICGYWMLYDSIGKREGLILHISFVCSCYCSIYGLVLVDSANRSAIYWSFVASTGLIIMACEHLTKVSMAWLEMRGIIMLIAMRGTLSAWDVARHRRRIQHPHEFFGYMLCPANCIFGPVISYNEYMAILRHPKPLNFRWGYSVFLSAGSAFFCLLVSTYIEIPKSANVFYTAFFVALSFRMSHYFVCYLSEFSMIAAGYKSGLNIYGKLDEDSWNYFIVKPFLVEFPQSLQQVINNWNIPMNKFLRNLFYIPSLHKGEFNALFSTFIISAMFHGFNVQVSVVLLHLGVFSFIQRRFRDKLSTRLNACLGIRQCERCFHKYQCTHQAVFFARLLFILWVMVDLAYLGCIMRNVDISYNKQEKIFMGILRTWKRLGYISHVGNFIMLVANYFL